MSKKKFRKVREGWELGDTSSLILFSIFLIFSIYFTLTISPYFVFAVILFTIIVLVGIIYLYQSKVYWEEIKE